MTETIVFDRKAVYMQRCADFVRAGYWHWASGEVRPERARALVKKFARLYGTDKTRHQRAYSKEQGEGAAVLLLYAPYQGKSAPKTGNIARHERAAEPHTVCFAPAMNEEGADVSLRTSHTGGTAPSTTVDEPPTAPLTPTTVKRTPHTDGSAPYNAFLQPSTAPVMSHTGIQTQHAAESEPQPQLYWMLLVTSGSNPAHQLERLRNATVAAGRIVVTGYELVQLPRAGQVKAAWTWRMEDATYKAWRLRLIAAARRRLTLLNTETALLARTPGFAGCRAQAKKLTQLAAGEWHRQHDSAQPLALPRLPYLQRLPNGGISLTNWLRRYTKLTSCTANTGVDAPATES